MDANLSHPDDQLAVLAEVVGTQRKVPAVEHMSPHPEPALRRLARFVDDLRRELEVAAATGRTDRCEALRGELALLDDLLLHEAASDLRLQRFTDGATCEAMSRPRPPGPWRSSPDGVRRPD